MIQNAGMNFMIYFKVINNGCCALIAIGTESRGLEKFDLAVKN